MEADLALTRSNGVEILGAMQEQYPELQPSPRKTWRSCGRWNRSLGRSEASPQKSEQPLPQRKKQFLTGCPTNCREWWRAYDESELQSAFEHSQR